MMKLAIVGVSGLMLAVTTLHAQDSLPEYFSKVIGDWSSTGELSNSDGEKIPFTEVWKGAADEQGVFSIRGTRELGTENQEFRWVYMWNASTELYECEYWHTGMAEPIRMEVSLTETSVEMRSPFGEPGSELLVSNTLEEGNLSGRVVLTSASGESLLIGEAIHTRQGSE